LAGDPADAIIRTVESDGADMIVMGTHGRRGISRLLMGSVAEAVVRRAPCPVLTVKQPAKVPVESGA
jgi:nucleotide-binding universal stress UspA family protein